MWSLLHVNIISQTKNSVWGLNGAFFHCLRPQKGGGGGGAKSGRNMLISGERLSKDNSHVVYLKHSLNPVDFITSYLVVIFTVFDH
jgi:hypothetical protein